MVYIPGRLLFRLAKALNDEPQSAWKTGSIVRPVLCQWCANLYFYQLIRRGFGSAESRRNEDHALGHAQTAAEDSLMEQLSRDFDCVPCPACGRYQTKMVRRLKWKALRKLAWMSVCLCLVTSAAVASIASYTTVRFYEVLQLTILSALVVGRAAFILFRNYNPNPGTPVGDPHPLIIPNDQADHFKERQILY